MGSLARLCCVSVVVAVAWAHPHPHSSPEVSKRDARGQTIVDSSDPTDKSRSMLVDLSEAYKGGVVPVALVYDSPEDDGASRPLREVQKAESREESSDDDLKEDTNVTVVNSVEGKTVREEKKQEKETRAVSKNSKLLDLEARETDENSEFGLGIQSRNNAPAIEAEQGDLNVEKPFVYNIQPLSFYSTETKEEENIINYINKIKEMRENQIKFQTSKENNKEENKPPVVTSEESVVADTEEEKRPIIKKIQHFETIIQPMMIDPQAQAQMYTGPSQGPYQHYPGFAGSPYPYPYQQNMYLPYNQGPQVIYLPNPFSESKTRYNSDNVRLLDDYFPIVIQNPINQMWTAMTNIIEYGPEADVCKKAKKGRVVEDDQTTEVEFPTERAKLVGSKADSWPRVTRLKVRKGGVAIAGPGGIATAGSGGTAIVGPGGTAYTTREGTAVVGPGGRVVHVPAFPAYGKKDGSNEFVPPPGSRTVAEGPIIYYDSPMNQENLPDPATPL